MTNYNGRKLSCGRDDGKFDKKEGEDEDEENGMRMRTVVRRRARVRTVVRRRARVRTVVRRRARVRIIGTGMGASAR